MTAESIGARHPITRSIGVRLLAVLLLYVLTGRLGLLLATANPSATAVWAPSGIALASLLLLGRRLWPAILLGAFIVNVTTASTVTTSLAIAIGNTLEAVIGATLVLRFARGERAFDHAPDVFKFAFLAGLLSTLLSTLIGVGALALAGALDTSNLKLVLLTWWLGDAGGMLVVAPVLILCFHDRSFRWIPERSIETAGLIFALFLVSTTVFLGWLPLGFTAYPLAFLTVPVLVWAAYRFGPREVALSMLVIAAAAIWGTLRGEGPFVRETLHESLLLIQVFLGAMAVTKLALAALVAERRRVQDAVLVGYEGLGLRFRRQRVDLIGALHDLEREVAARTVAEAALRKSEERFRSVAETALDGIITANHRGTIVYFNPAAERIFGRGAHDTVGRSLESLMPARFHRLHGEGFERYISTGDAMILGRVVELTGLRRDGCEFPIELSISSWRAEGELYFTAMVRDLSQRKAAEASLRESEASLAQAQALAHIGSWRWEVDADEIHCSDELYRILGIEARPMPSQIWLGLVHPDDRPAVRERFDSCARLGGSFALDYRIVRPDRSVQWLHGRGEAMSSGLGPTRLRGTAQDITDRKLGEQRIQDFNTQLERRVRERTAQLRRSNQDLQQFASHAAHDLREPLRTVGSYTDILIRRYHGRLDRDADEFMAHITGGVSWMGALIDALLTYSSVGAARVRRTVVEGEVVLAQAVANLERVIEESAAIVTHDPLPRIKGDATQLVLLFQNLIGNAIKFRGERQPRVHVEVERLRRRLRFTVRDNGLGMDPRHTERIFAVFQRLHDREEYPGTGIGLAVCRKIVERQGGRIWAESIRGEGSAFHFTLPAALAKETTRNESACDSKEDCGTSALP